MTRHLPTAAALAALLLLYGWMGKDDMAEQERAASYTAEIMAQAKQEALAKADFNRLKRQGDEMLALGEVK
jgi:hypothetical protein